MDTRRNAGNDFTKYTPDIRCNDVLEVILNSNLDIY